MSELRTLGRSGLKVGPLAFGGAQIGNLGKAVSSSQARETVDTAWDCGIRYFDTAPHYGLGLSEVRLGDALRGRPRDDYLISTKVGRLLVPNPDGRLPDVEGFRVAPALKRRYDYSRDGVLRSIEDSLTRLRLDRIDIVYVHDPDNHYAQAVDEAFPTLDQLRSEGVIGSYGAGMNQAQMLARFVQETDADVMMAAGVVTLLEDSALDSLLPEAARRQVSVIAAAPFNSGLLATDHPSTDATFAYAKATRQLVDRAERIAELCRSHGVPLPAAALQWALRHGEVPTVCVGMRSPAQVRRNVELMSMPVPRALWADLDASGLTRDGASLV